MAPQTKFTKHLYELKPLLEKDDKKTYTLYQLYDFFRSKKLDTVFNGLKTKGISFSIVFYQLIEMTILHFSVNQYSQRSKSGMGMKDTFYRLKNDSGIDWRKIIYILANRLLFLIKANQDIPNSKPSCLIADDTTISKRGKSMEGIGKVFDHKDHSYKLGFKGLFLSFCDGKSFLPLDFSMHSEKGKHSERPFGMTVSEIRKQHSIKRDPSAPGATRKQELTVSKTAKLMEMIKGAWKHGIRADYLLVDSWFVDEALIRFVLKSKMFLLGMCKMDKRLYLHQDKQSNARQLLEHCKRTKAKRSRTIKARYYEVLVTYKGIQIKLFFSKFNNQKDWSLLITDNYKLSFEKAVEIYQIRWSTEVFFKEAKQYFHLGKCSSGNFDAQIADVSIIVCAYLMFTLRRRFQAYEGLGKIFIDVQHEIIELTLWERIWGVFVELQMSILKTYGLNVDELLSDAIVDESVMKFLILLLEGQSEIINTNKIKNAA